MKNLRLHFMGIGGPGISGVAQMLHAAGAVVSGCDHHASETTRALQEAGIAVEIGHSTVHLKDVDVLAISPMVLSLNPDSPELLAAGERGIRVITWQELLGEMMQGKCLLAVSGVHGKGTTAAMLALMLVDAGLDPTCEIGAVVPRFGSNYRLGKSQYMVNEADEFGHNFWHYHPRLTIVTSIEYEHPEFFGDYEAYLAAFEHFIAGMDMQGDWPLPPTLILNVDVPGCLELRKRLHHWPGRILTYAVRGAESIEEPAESDLIPDAIAGGYLEALPIVGERADFEAYDVRLEGETSFRVRTGEADIVDGAIHLQLPGMHNVQNAMAALAAAHIVGVDADTIVKTLEGFSGTRRRFEIRHQGAALSIDGQPLDVVLIDDYAHHPTAIVATLEATRKRYQGRRLIAVYQPHMYSRTKVFFAQFLQSFNAADVVVITDIFPARERDTGMIHARDLVAAMAQQPHFIQQGGQVVYGGDIQHTERLLHKLMRSGDVVLIMGAGDVYTVTEQLLQDAALA